MIPRFTFQILSSIFLFCGAAVTYADTFLGDTSDVYASADFGDADFNEPGFSTANSKHLSFGVRYDEFQFNLNRVEFSGLFYRSRGDTEIEIDGYGLGVDYRLSKERMSLLVGGGVFQSKAEYQFLGRELPSESDTSPYIQSQLSLQLYKGLNGYISWRKYFDVSGADIKLYTAGFRYYFGSL